MAGSKAPATLFIGAIVTAGLVGWLSLGSSLPTDKAAPVDRGRAIDASVPSEPVPTAQDGTGAESGVPATAGAGEVLDLCGLGRMPVPVGTPIDPPPAWQALPTPLAADVMAAAQAQVMARLAAGSDRQRAAALLMRLPHAEDSDERAALAAQVAAIERAAHDPVISAWTVSICDSDPEVCDADIARRWVDLERDNAAAWMALSRRQFAVPDEADLGMALANRHDVHHGALVATVRKAWPEGEASYLQLPILLHALAVDGMATMALMQGTFNHCKAPLAGSPRAASCKALAESMVQRGDTVLSHKLGAAIGAKLGWPPERLAALKAESEALFPAGPGLHGDRQPYSCESLDRLRGWIDAVEQTGEKASARAMLKAPG